MIYNPLGIHYCMIDNTDIDLLDPSPYRAPWAPNRRQRQPSPAQTNASLRPAPRTLALGGVGKTHVIHMEYVYIYRYLWYWYDSDSDSDCDCGHAINQLQRLQDTYIAYHKVVTWYNDPAPTPPPDGKRKIAHPPSRAVSPPWPAKRWMNDFATVVDISHR